MDLWNTSGPSIETRFFFSRFDPRIERSLDARIFHVSIQGSSPVELKTSDLNVLRKRLYLRGSLARNVSNKKYCFRATQGTFHKSILL